MKMSFETKKDSFKLMNNTFYGKTRKKMNDRLVNNAKNYKSYKNESL